MPFRITGEHIDQYHRDGFTVFRQLIPASLLKELRIMAEKGRAITRERNGAQAQRLQPIVGVIDDTSAFETFARLPELTHAIETLFGQDFAFSTLPGSDQKPSAGILYEPRDSPWCTQWHRDWRDNIPGLDVPQWEQRMLDVRLFNQVNCPLYEDTCTWVAPGSHLRRDLPAEIERFPMRPVPGPDLTGLSNEEAEYACLDYVRSMPGAVRADLDAGDFMLYRNSLWHLGNYVPYKIRATIHASVMTEAFDAWISGWPKRADGKAEMMNPNLHTPEYQAWEAAQPVGA